MSASRLTRRTFLAAAAAMLCLAAFAAAPPAKIPRTPVESSNLAGIGYDAPSRTLEIEFQKGGVYRYFDVPRALHEGLMAAKSKGGYFHDHIRSKFRFVKTGPPPKPPK